MLIKRKQNKNDYPALPHGERLRRAKAMLDDEVNGYTYADIAAACETSVGYARVMVCRLTANDMLI